MKKTQPRRRCFSPHPESLEGRSLMATWGNPWPDATALTMSFAPDGTDIGGAPSVLHGAMQGLTAAGKDWQLEILRAFQTWAVHANININVTPDAGVAFGTPGALQGDGRFGDIRLGAVPQSAENLILNQPFSYPAGTWAGDVFLNSNAAFGIGQGDAVDLYTGMLNEAGNVLGLEDVNDQNSAMYISYIGPKTSLTRDDISRIQALYGERAHDEHDASKRNEGFSSATKISTVNVAGTNAKSSKVTVRADLTDMSDKDFYAFSTSLVPEPLTIHFKTSGISSLAAKVTVYDASRRVVQTATAVDPRSGDMAISLPRPQPDSTYYVSVERGTADAFGVGGYMLRVVPDRVD